MRVKLQESMWLVKYEDAETPILTPPLATDRATGLSVIGILKEPKIVRVFASGEEIDVSIPSDIPILQTICTCDKCNRERNRIPPSVESLHHPELPDRVASSGESAG